ncbi:MAG: 50S ribosomal protein L6 [Candidatus Kapaibacterium sp.]|nr:MAG: 50S ribosomal protein L6 [Candidatus Kapabacteria bacterium]
MSRIGKKIISIPKDAQVTINGQSVKVKGPKGELEFNIPDAISHEMKDGNMSFARSSDEKHVRALHGLVRAMINSMIEGVTKGFTKTLDIEGVGYKVELRGKNLYLSLGYSHPILFIPPPGITFAAITATQLTVTGVDKQLVGEVSAKLRALRAPEPYKGKGVRYQGEYIRRKAGKSGGKGK